MEGEGERKRESTPSSPFVLCGCGSVWSEAGRMVPGPLAARAPGSTLGSANLISPLPVSDGTSTDSCLYPTADCGHTRPDRGRCPCLYPTAEVDTLDLTLPGPVPDSTSQSPHTVSLPESLVKRRKILRHRKG